MVSRLIVVALCLVSLLAVGCGGAVFQTGEPWDPKETPFFDDGIDMVEDLSALSGKWGYTAENEFEGRVQLADLIAEVDVMAVQTTSGLNGESAKRIEVKVARVIYGEAPSENFHLVSKKEAPGHELILRYERHLTGRFFVFVRWFQDDNGAPGHHFHLSPASDKLTPEVERRIALRKREEAEAAVQK